MDTLTLDSSNEKKILLLFSRFRLYDLRFKKFKFSSHFSKRRNNFSFSISYLLIVILHFT